MLPIIDPQNDTPSHLTVTEFSRVIHADHNMIVELIEYQIIQPSGTQAENWQFDSLCVTRAKHALSFIQDLEVNMPGVALAFELLDQIEHLKQHHSIDL